MRSTDGVTCAMPNVQLNGRCDPVAGTHNLTVEPRGCSHAEVGLWYIILLSFPPLLVRDQTTGDLELPRAQAASSAPLLAARHNFTPACGTRTAQQGD